EYTHMITLQVNKIYIQKTFLRNPFFQFSNLKEYVPAISSMKTFIVSPDFLGDLKLHISVPSAMEIKEIQPIEKLKMVERFFSYMEKKIRSNYMKERGTPVFEGVSFSKLINNYQVEL